MAHRVFVSYATEDREIADRSIAKLEKNGIGCWVSHRDVKPGEEWASSIVDAIEQSQIVVLIYSERSNESQQVLREMERAVGANLPIVPFLIEDKPLSKSMSYFLGSTHWLNASKISTDEGIRLLVNTLQKLLQPKSAQSLESKLKPASLMLPTPILLKRIYWLGILSPILFILLALIPSLQNNEELAQFLGLVVLFCLGFGMYGLLWGRANWRSSVFVGFLVATIILFIGFVVFPVL
jgi:TIR domain